MFILTPKRLANHRRTLAALSLAALSMAGTANASVVVEGNITPPDLATWNPYSTASYVGNYGDGKITITDGSTLEASSISLGNDTSTGAIVVDGAGSTLNAYLYIGRSYTGSLSVTNGATANGNITIQNNSTATVSGNSSKLNSYYFQLSNGSTRIDKGGYLLTSGHAYVGYYGNGAVTINGVGSTWEVSGGGANIGMYSGDSGILTIANGGSVAVWNSDINISTGGIVALDVGHNSSLTAHWNLTNNGTIRLAAGAGLATGSIYNPISVAGSWTGTGSIKTLGGSWDTASRTFTVSAAATGHTGEGVTIDTASVQRVLITDTASHKSVGASFDATTTSSELTFTANALSSAESASLAAQDGVGTILSGWTFTASGYTSGDPVYLSLEVGADQQTDDLTVWHYDGTEWAKITPADFSYDGTYASFTVDGFSGYAVTSTAVPEAATLGLLLTGGMGLLLRKQRH